MTHWRKLHNPTEYLAEYDLPDGVDVPVTIAAVDQGELRAIGGQGKKDRKPILRLVGKKKKLIAGITNCKIIASLHGEAIEGWVGKRIVLYKTTTARSDGATVKCIRVSNYIPAEKPNEPEAADDVEPPRPIDPVADADSVVVDEVDT